MRLNSIEEAISDIKLGKVIIVVDDEDRENEGDFVAAANCVTPEMINFMATHGRGLICAPLVEERCDELGLELMVNTNSAAYETPFTVSVDLIGYGCTTGISASDRSKTVKALIDPNIKPEELGKPGHIFPLRAKSGGVLRRMGHTEAAVDLAKLAGFEPAGVIVEIMNEDGTMARLPELLKIAERFDLKIISIADLIKYRLENESLIEGKSEIQLETPFGQFTLQAFEQTTTDDTHLTLRMGNWNESDEVPVRVHSSTLFNDLKSVLDNNYSPSLQDVMRYIGNHGKGLIVIMNQHNKDHNLVQTLETMKKTGSLDPSKLPLKMDNRDYGVGAQIIRELGVRKMQLITSNTKAKHINLGFGLEVCSTINLMEHSAV